MACGICGSSGHNRRTHAEHEAPQDQALIESAPGTADLLKRLQASVDRACAGRARSTSSEVGKEEDPPTSHGPDAGQAHDDQSADWSDTDLPEPVIASGLDEFAADFTVPRCQECGEPLDEGQTLLCGSCAVQDQHECEPAPDQVFYCRHCGADLLSPEVRTFSDDAARVLELKPRITPPWRTALGPDEPIRITKPGVYELTAEEYHSFEVTGDWISNSDVKALLKSCPAQFDYDRRNAVRKTSDAFDFGHVWHAVILGKGEAYRVFEPKKLDGRTADGKAQKREVDAARAAGITPIYGDQFALIEAMAEAVKADPVPYDLLTRPGRSEVCLFWLEYVRITDPANSLYGQVVEVKRRAMIDRLPDMPENPDETVTLVDGKTAEEVKPDDDMRKKVHDYGYHRQADTYESAIRALFGRDAQVTFVFQSKKRPHLITPVDLDTPAMRVAAAQNHEALQVWAECVATGVWPGYTKGVATSGVPAWIERQYEEAIEVIS